jgi:hypothetical protein
VIVPDCPTEVAPCEGSRHPRRDPRCPPEDIPRIDRVSCILLWIFWWRTSRHLYRDPRCPEDIPRIRRVSYIWTFCWRSRHPWRDPRCPEDIPRIHRVACIWNFWWRPHPSVLVSIRSRPQAILLLLVPVLLLFIIVIISFGLLIPWGLFFNALNQIQHQSAVLASSPYDRLCRVP